MKSIKKIIGLSLVVALTIGSVIAQTAKKNFDPTTRANKHTKRLTKELSLSTEQTAQVSKINLEFAEKMKAIKAEGKDKEATRTAMKSLRTDQKAAITAVLSPEQATKFETMKGRKGGRKGKGGKGAKGANKSPQERAQHRTERLTKALDLSTDQAAKVTEINLAYGEKMKAIKDASTDKEASKTAVQALRGEQKTAIKAVLTPEQITKFEAMKDRKRGKRGKDGKGSRGE